MRNVRPEAAFIRSYIHFYTVSSTKRLFSMPHNCKPMWWIIDLDVREAQGGPNDSFSVLFFTTPLPVRPSHRVERFWQGKTHEWYITLSGTLLGLHYDLFSMILRFRSAKFHQHDVGPGPCRPFYEPERTLYPKWSTQINTLLYNHATQELSLTGPPGMNVWATRGVFFTAMANAIFIILIPLSCRMAGCPLGRYRFRTRQESGRSRVSTFCITR